LGAPKGKRCPERHLLHIRCDRHDSGASGSPGTGLGIADKVAPVTMGTAAVIDATARYSCLVQANEEFFLENF